MPQARLFSAVSLLLDSATRSKKHGQNFRSSRHCFQPRQVRADTYFRMLKRDATVHLLLACALATAMLTDLQLPAVTGPLPTVRGGAGPAIEKVDTVPAR